MLPSDDDDSMALRIRLIHRRIEAIYYMMAIIFVSGIMCGGYYIAHRQWGFGDTTSVFMGLFVASLFVMVMRKKFEE